MKIIFKTVLTSILFTPILSFGQTYVSVAQYETKSIMGVVSTSGNLSSSSWSKDTVTIILDLNRGQITVEKRTCSTSVFNITPSSESEGFQIVSSNNLRGNNHSSNSLEDPEVLWQMVKITPRSIDFSAYSQYSGTEYIESFFIKK